MRSFDSCSHGGKKSISSSACIRLPVLVSQTSSTMSSANGVLRRLYVSHTLSTWNSRTFEFGAVLFLASLFPGTLLYASLYALTRAAAATLLSSWVGRSIDNWDRLRCVRASIVGQRLPVAISCLIFVVLSRLDSKRSTTPWMEWALFSAAVVLACIEKLASVANTVSVERDWVRALYAERWLL